MELRVAVSEEVGDRERTALRALWADAFGDRFSDDDADHAYGGVHVIAADGPVIIAHASAVPRRIEIGDTWHEVGYVEAVATSPERQGSGVGRAVMERLQAEMERHWQVAFLSTGRARGFYERLGWRVWQGRSHVLTAGGRVPTDDEHGGIMALALDPAFTLDLTLPITCEERSGDDW